MSDTAVFEWKLPRATRPHRASGDRPATDPSGSQRRLPVIRIPVTPENRDQLRHLRARELDLWSEGSKPAQPNQPEGTDETEPSPRVTASSDRQAQFLLILLGIGTSGAALRGDTMLPAFRDFWQFLERILERLVS